MKAASIFLAWTLGAIASAFRQRPRCRCGAETVDDGLGFGLCKPCQRAEWEAPDSGPLTLRPKELQAMGVGRT